MMNKKDEDKTKEQLLKEVARTRESLRQCTAALQARNQDLDDLARYVVSEFRSPLGMIIGYAELLEEEYATLPEEELRHSIYAIKQSGHKLSEMANVLLLLANSRRLFDNVWYAAYLATMGETSLSEWAEEKGEIVREAYRFTCLPAFFAPLIIRAWATGGETPHFQAIAKLGSAWADFEDEDTDEPVSASQEAAWTLAAETWDCLVAAVEESRFWSDDSSLEQLGWLKMVGTGGEEWIFEGWRDGTYKARTVWSPDEERAHAAYTLGQSFVKCLPGWFTLEMARSWALDSWPEMDPRFPE
jgi:hypothetical protein